MLTHLGCGGSTFSLILDFGKTLKEADVKSGMNVEQEDGFKEIKILVWKTLSSTSC